MSLQEVNMCKWKCVFVLMATGLFVFTASAQTALNNDSIVKMTRAGLGEDVIITLITTQGGQFSVMPDSVIELKQAGVSDKIIAAMIGKADQPRNAPVTATQSTGPLAASTGIPKPLDLSRSALILPFGSSVNDPDAAGLPDITRALTIQILKYNRTFSALLTPEEATGKSTTVEISAELVDFAPGNMAARFALGGLGAGRAHAGFNFTVKECATGKVLWQKTIKETASYFSSSASSSAQRAELPEKIAKTFVEELQKARLSVLFQ
jgi:hypothetical protein